jgi:hypothetical protein
VIVGNGFKVNIYTCAGNGVKSEVRVLPCEAAVSHQAQQMYPDSTLTLKDILEFLHLGFAAQLF